MTPKPRQSLVTTLDFALLRGAIEEMPLGVATTRDGDILHANGALERMWGARPGGLDGRTLEMLLGGETTQRVRAALAKSRVFDDRIRGRGLDGREIVAELHAERYTASAGVGGFLLIRDVSYEAGALGRLVDQLGGAFFRYNIQGSRLEHITSSIAQLTGLDARACMENPSALVELVAPHERERLRAIYQRLVRRDVASATADLRLLRAGGPPEVLHVDLTGRRDAEGVVRHIEGVLTRARGSVGKSTGTLLGMVAPGGATIATPPPAAPIESRPPWARSSAPPASPDAMVELSQDLLQQVTELMSAATADAGALSTLVAAVGPALPEGTAEVFNARLESMMASVTIASSFCRRVRRSLGGRVSRSAFVDVLESVRVALAPLIGEHSVVAVAGNAGGTFLRGPLDSLVLVLVQLGLRAFRLGGSGLLRLEAKRRRPGVGSPSEIVVEIIGERPVENEVNAVYDAESGPIPASPRPADADRTSELAGALLASAGGSIEIDEWTMHAARTAVVLREDTG